MATVEELAYFAGIVDGEGTLCIAANSNGNMAVAQFNITNYNSELLAWLQVRFGGIPGYRKSDKKWIRQRWNYQEMLPILQSILPYLVAKNKQAQLVCTLVSECSTYSVGNLCRSVRKALGDKLAAECVRLNA